MRTDLAYGKKRITIELPDGWDITVVRPAYQPELLSPAESIREALRRPIGSSPLREMVGENARVGIVVNDITRATPTEILVNGIVEELLAVLPATQITLYVALGTHRENTEAELRGMLGDTLYETFRIVQNDAFDRSTQVCVEKSSQGREVWINKSFVEEDLHILTGFIEPHLFAGFSGGGKAIMPGMAGFSTIMGHHGAEMIANPNVTWGVTDGNPFWAEILEIGKMMNPFLVNVTMNRDKEITQIFAGDLAQAHAEGCNHAKDVAMVAVDKPFDIILTSNSGYPLDLNLYQSVKGMSAAAQVVKDGGAILIAAECWDGIPDHGLFSELLAAADSPTEFMHTIFSPGYAKHDQWQVQVLAQVLLKADVYVHSAHLTDEALRMCMLNAASDLEKTMQSLVAKYGAHAKVCVLPEGPLTIPYLSSL